MFSGRVTLIDIFAVAVLEGLCGSVFITAQTSAVPRLVPHDQVPAATAANEARQYGVQLAGPPLDGVLYAVGRTLPFLANAASCAVSVITLLLIRTPLQDTREARHGNRLTGLGDGLRFVWQSDVIRAILLIAGPLVTGHSPW